MIMIFFWEIIQCYGTKFYLIPFLFSKNLSLNLKNKENYSKTYLKLNSKVMTILLKP